MHFHFTLIPMRIFPHHILRFISGVFCFVLWLQPAAAQLFEKTFGGPQDEHAIAGVPCRNGDYLVAGYTYSFGEGKSDIWVMRLGRDGKEMWRAYKGGADFDWPSSIIETRDGHIVVAGHTQNATTGIKKAWVFKLDKRGNEIWSKTYGGDKTDEAEGIVETYDGGYAVVGYTHSFSRGSSDLWILRLDSKGTELWSKNYGGKDADEGHAIIETQDRCLVVAGFTESPGKGEFEPKGKADIVVLKVDSAGAQRWVRRYGGERNENAEALALGADGAIFVAGWTASEGVGSLDGTVIKLDASGVFQWQRTIGGDKKDAFYGAVQCADGGVALAGTSASENPGTAMWLVRLNAKGELRWERRMEGASDNFGHSISQTHDGGFFVAGATKNNTAGGADMWVLKTGADGKVRDVVIPAAAPVAAAPAESKPAPAFKPNLYILAIGVSEYLDPAANLTFAHSDAEAVADRFTQMEGKLFNKVHIKKVLNREATLVNIKTGISWLETEATQRDVIIMFVSSHGALDHKGNLYILPTDFNSYNLFATALNIRDLTEGINGVPCKKLVFLDACHSGQSGFDLLQLGSAKAANLDQVVQELINKEPGLTVMTSSSGKEYSYETTSWGHGAFTLAILEGLDGRADVDGDMVVTLSELDLYVSERVKALTRGRQHPFTPINLFGNIPLFVLE